MRQVQIAPLTFYRIFHDHPLPSSSEEHSDSGFFSFSEIKCWREVVEEVNRYGIDFWFCRFYGVVGVHRQDFFWWVFLFCSEWVPRWCSGLWWVWCLHRRNLSFIPNFSSYLIHYSHYKHPNKLVLSLVVICSSSFIFFIINLSLKISFQNDCLPKTFSLLLWSNLNTVTTVLKLVFFILSRRGNKEEGTKMRKLLFCDRL